MDVDWIILADAAEVVNNKLYLIGGGWDALTINAPLPVVHPCAVAVAFRVPWDETNRRHGVEVLVADQDGNELARIAGQIEVGRPAGIPLGQAQRVQMAAQLGLPLDRPGDYRVVVRIGGEEARAVTFQVVPGAMAAPQSSNVR